MNVILLYLNFCVNLQENLKNAPNNSPYNCLWFAILPRSKNWTFPICSCSKMDHFVLLFCHLLPQPCTHANGLRQEP